MFIRVGVAVVCVDADTFSVADKLFAQHGTPIIRRAERGAFFGIRQERLHSVFDRRIQGRMRRLARQFEKFSDLGFSIGGVLYLRDLFRNRRKMLFCSGTVAIAGVA